MTYKGLKLAADILDSAGSPLLGSSWGKDGAPPGPIDRGRETTEAGKQAQAPWDPKELPLELTKIPDWLRRIQLPPIGQLGDLADTIQKVAHEVEHALTFLKDFLEKSRVNMPAVRLQADDYRNAGSAMQAVNKSAADATTALRTGWEGAAGDAAKARIGEYGGVGRGAQAVYGGMAAATNKAGMELTEARNAAIRCVQDTGRRIANAMPSFDSKLRATIKALVTKGPEAAAEEIRKAVEQCLAAIMNEFRMLLSNIAVAVRPHATSGVGQLGQLAALAGVADRAKVALETGVDKGTGPGALSINSFAASVMGPEGQDIDGQILPMCGEGYKARPPFESVTDPTELAKLGLTPEMLKNDQIGFACYVFRDPTTGRVIVTFGGTNFTNAADIMEDAEGGVTFSQQSAAALKVAQALAGSGQRDNVVFGGHSMGGRLAAVASMETGCPAVTYNAAGVSDSTIAYYAAQKGITVEEFKKQLEQQVRVYQTDDDMLTNLQEKQAETKDAMPDAVGTKIKLPGEKQNPGFNDQIEGHQLPNIQRQYDRQYGTNTQDPNNPDYHRKR